MYELEVGTSAAQLERLCNLASSEWNWSSRWHPGELTWFWWESGGPASDDRVATWQVDGRVAAWAWLRGGCRLDLQVAAADRVVLDDVLAWFEAETNDGRRRITVLDTQTEIISALTAHGYRADLTETFFAHLSLDMSGLAPPPTLTDGYSLRSLDPLNDLARRTSLHREVFGSPEDLEPSTESYRRLADDPRYDIGLDWVVCDEEGRFVSFCLSWLDEASRVVVLEPVGTLLQHRRRGLALSAISASLSAAAERGATHARVCARVDSAAHATYTALGFTQYARNLTFLC